jgi:phage terminase large subunit-like protein
MTAKKNGKTTYSGATMLIALLMNTRPRAEFLLIAPTVMVADLCFQQCIGMIEGAGFLREDADVRMKVQEHLRTITDLDTGAKLRIKSFDASVLTGTKASAYLVDELQEVARSPDALRVLGQLNGGMVSNPESFRIYIFTQSDQPPVGVHRSELNSARATRDGKISSDILPVLYEFPDDMIASGEWRDPQHWWMVNPNYGRSLTIDRLVEDWERAQNAGDDEQRRWQSQHLNIEVGMSNRDNAWSGAADWQACGDQGLSLDVLLLRCEVVTLGYDEGGQDDLLGFAVLGRDAKTRQLLLWSHAWCCDKALERRKGEASRWRDFAARGELTIVPQMSDGLRQVADLIQRVDKSGKLPAANAIGVDAYGGVSLSDELAVRGIAQERLAGVPQGWKLNSSIRTMERKLAEGAITHGASTLMDYCVSNAKIEVHGNAISITKAASGSAKIDPLIAAFCALHMMNLNPTVATHVQLRHAILARGGFA